MTTLLNLSFVFALVAPRLIPRFAHRQRRVALERFSQRLIARRALIQGDLSRAAHD